MFLTRTEYDRGVNTFSPEGRLFQVEYAIEAIKLGSTAIGLKTKEGVVLAVEKRITSPLLEPSSVEKIMEIDEHIGCAMSGLIADARTLVEHARVETQNHRFSYGEPMTVESTTQALCDLALRFGEGEEESMVLTSDPSSIDFCCCYPRDFSAIRRVLFLNFGDDPSKLASMHALVLCFEAVSGLHVNVVENELFGITEITGFSAAMG
ncbi:hypothetical protein GIB67_009692 [Kingdonia uniflora]|uniref:Proteasome subunit alpha type n=1 Tax=Kingdonia uniflora TaxID=39325 RepID=A0A7J7LB35_9MAGN|nr:hypothetical protein GIB67_009692 [Kingdonia uniflora]